MIPLSTAFLATKPAAIIESGFEVFVQDVIAANTTEPCLKACYYPLNLNFCSILTFYLATPNPLNPTLFGTHSVKSLFISDNGTLSCGLFGPDTHGSTFDKSNYRTSVKLMLSLAV